MAITINFEIVGNKEVSDWFTAEDLTITGKMERNLVDFNNSDGDIPLSIGKIGTISKVIVNSTSAVNLKVTTISGIVNIPITGLFYWSVNPSFSNILSGIAISATDESDSDATVSIFGE
jgi:predicted membrane protein